MMMAIRWRSGWRVGARSLFAAVLLAAACGGEKPDASSSVDEKRATSSSLGEQSATAANAVLEWNRIANEQLALAGLRLAFHTRILAITQAAVFDAVNAIDGRYAPYAVSPAVARGTSAEAAAVAAAHGALVRLLPGRSAAFDAALARSLAVIPDGPAKVMGVALGDAVASQIIALRAGDGSARAATYVPAGSAPGTYQSTPPNFQNPVEVAWGDVTPFVLHRNDQFFPAGPPMLSSDRWVREFDEVKSLGSADSVQRTSEQTATATFWLENSNFTWNAIARDVAAQRRLELVEAARLLALLNLATADAIIAGFHIKYVYAFWRPITAIRATDTGNPAAIRDPTWSPMVSALDPLRYVPAFRNTPPHPDYTSNHSIYSGAAAAVLERFFHDDAVEFTVTTSTASAGPRAFSGFQAAALECALSRIYAGIHFRSANLDGLRTGRLIGKHAARTLLRRNEESSRKDDDRGEGAVTGWTTVDLTSVGSGCATGGIGYTGCENRARAHTEFVAVEEDVYIIGGDCPVSQDPSSCRKFVDQMRWDGTSFDFVKRADLILPGVSYVNNNDNGRVLPYSGTRGHFAVYLPEQGASGQILVGTGFALFFPPVQNTALYDIALDRWAAAANMPFGLNMPHTNAAVLDDGRVLVATGVSSDRAENPIAFDGTPQPWDVVGGVFKSPYNTSRHTFLYDPAADSWTTTDMSIGRGDSALLKLGHGQIAVVGGRVAFPLFASWAEFPFRTSLEIFSPEVESWKSYEMPAGGRFGANMVRMPDDRLLVAGGFVRVPGGPGGAFLLGTRSDAFIFDPDTGAFSDIVGGLGDSRGGGLSLPQPDGTVLFVGGQDGTVNAKAETRIVSFAGDPPAPTGVAGPPLPSFSYQYCPLTPSGCGNDCSGCPTNPSCKGCTQPINWTTLTMGYTQAVNMRAAITTAGKSIVGSGFDVCRNRPGCEAKDQRYCAVDAGGQPISACAEAACSTAADCKQATAKCVSGRCVDQLYRAGQLYVSTNGQVRSSGSNEKSLVHLRALGELAGEFP